MNRYLRRLSGKIGLVLVIFAFILSFHYSQNLGIAAEGAASVATTEATATGAGATAIGAGTGAAAGLSTTAMVGIAVGAAVVAAVIVNALTDGDKSAAVHHAAPSH